MGALLWLLQDFRHRLKQQSRQEKQRNHLPKTNAAKILNVTSFTPPKDNLHEAIDLLHEVEISGGDFRYPALGLAGPLLTEVGKAFPQNFILIYLVTSYKKRQVWNAYLAKMFGDPDSPQPIADPNDLRKMMMRTSSKELLLEAFGSVPNGLVRALSLLGLEGQHPQIYIQLHEQMEKSATLCKAYSHASKIEASTVTAVAALPENLKSYELAKQFKKPEDIKKLVFAVDTLTQNDHEKYIDLCDKVVTAAKRGHSVAAVLKREYFKLSFCDPIVQNSDQCRHIDSAHKMMVSAKRFNNCINTYIFQALRNELQFYEFLVDSRPVAVISIKSY